jgi:hypothetical protein
MNCVAVLGGSEQRMGHQGAEVPSQAEIAEWRSLWTLLSTWYGSSSSETFFPSSLLQHGKAKRRQT